MDPKAAAIDFDTSPNNLEAFWMPFTWNRRFKQHPLLLASRSRSPTTACAATRPAPA